MKDRQDNIIDHSYDLDLRYSYVPVAVPVPVRVNCNKKSKIETLNGIIIVNHGLDLSESLVHSDNTIAIDISFLYSNANADDEMLRSSAVIDYP